MGRAYGVSLRPNQAVAPAAQFTRSVLNGIGGEQAPRLAHPQYHSKNQTLSEQIVTV